MSSVSTDLYEEISEPNKSHTNRIIKIACKTTFIAPNGLFRNTERFFEKIILVDNLSLLCNTNWSLIIINWSLNWSLDCKYNPKLLIWKVFHFSVVFLL